MKTQKSIFFKFKKEDESTLPVFRSSALFYFCVSESNDTELHFLNYWRLKRDINGLTFSIKCYDMLGRSLFVEENINIFNGANLISLRTLLANKLGEDYPSEAVLNSKSLVVKIYLYLPSGCKVQKDLMAHLAHNPTNLFQIEWWYTICYLHHSWRKRGTKPYRRNLFRAVFIIHNGPTDLIDDDMEINQSINQRKQLFKVPTINWLEKTKIFWLKDLCDYRSVTKNKIGMFTVKFRVGGYFRELLQG